MEIRAIFAALQVLYSLNVKWFQKWHMSFFKKIRSLRTPPGHNMPLYNITLLNNSTFIKNQNFETFKRICSTHGSDSIFFSFWQALTFFATLFVNTFALALVINALMSISIISVRDYQISRIRILISDQNWQSSMQLFIIPWTISAVCVQNTPTKKGINNCIISVLNIQI